MAEISTFIKEQVHLPLAVCLFTSLLCEEQHIPHPPEDAAFKLLRWKWRSGPYQTPNVQCLDHGFPSLQNCEK